MLPRLPRQRRLHTRSPHRWGYPQRICHSTRSSFLRCHNRCRWHRGFLQGGHPRQCPMHHSRVRWVFCRTRPQQQQPSFPNICPAPPTPNIRETIGAPRYHKLDFPKFDGKEDPLTWLNRCEQFFWGQRTDEASKVWLAAYHMVGVAQEWYMHLERDEGMPSWSRFKRVL